MHPKKRKQRPNTPPNTTASPTTPLKIEKSLKILKKKRSMRQKVALMVVLR